MNNEINGIMDQALDGIGRQDITQFRNIVNEKRFDSHNLFTNSFITPIVSSEYYVQIQICLFNSGNNVVE